jgi:hypothetical protein
MALTAAAVIVGSAVIPVRPDLPGLGDFIDGGEVASLLLSRVTVPVLYFITHQRRANVASDELPSSSPAGAIP